MPNSSTATGGSCAFLRIRPGRLIRDIRRKTAGHPIASAFETALARAVQIRSQQQRQRLEALFLPCPGGRAAARAPHTLEFGVKVSIVATNARAPRPVRAARRDAGYPYDGHTFRAVIDETQRLTGRENKRAYVDKGYRGHDAPNPRRVFISGQKRGVFGSIKRELRRRAAIEPDRP